MRMNFLNTRGNATLGIGICARCKMKFALGELWSDPNSPGLKVCHRCIDNYDPYREPPKQPERLTLPVTRPDEKLE